MQKIPTLFVRDYETILHGSEPIDDIPSIEGVRNELTNITGYKTKKGRFLATEQVTPGCEWVIKGEGVATRKWDGTCCKIENGILYKRYDAKNGKIPPEGFIPAQDPDPITGHWPGWLIVDRSSENRWINETYENVLMLKQVESLEDGTYEAVGPKINGNKDQLPQHQLIKHGYQLCEDCPRYFEGIKQYLSNGVPIEGVVWHHPDGRMCKIKSSDFGLKW